MLADDEEAFKVSTQQHIENEPDRGADRRTRSTERL
jgi:hypothetical protein